MVIKLKIKIINQHKKLKHLYMNVFKYFINNNKKMFKYNNINYKIIKLNNYYINHKK